MPSIGENGNHIVAKSFCIKWWVGSCKSCHGVNPGLTHGAPQNLILYKDTHQFKNTLQVKRF